jgi:N-acetyl-1-D-myo-inositol-2-amino-2-deoxy-alpha-D-glucopyranoside deacetylase
MKKGAASAARGVAVGMLAALFVAAAGTALHRQAAVVAGVGLYWGVCAALLLLASVQLWLVAWSRSVIPTAVAGIGAYTAVGVLSSGGPDRMLILGDAVGNTWIFGIAGVSLIMLLVAARLRAKWNSSAAAVAAPASRR